MSKLIAPERRSALGSGRIPDEQAGINEGKRSRGVPAAAQGARTDRRTEMPRGYTQPDTRMKERTIPIGRWGAVLCLCVFIAAMIVPAPPLPERHDAALGFEWLLGGPNLVGIFFLPAHILFLAGAAKCLAGSVRGLVLVSVLAVSAGVVTGGWFVVVPQYHKSTLLKYPAFPLWVLSLLLLLIVAVMLDVRSTAEKRGAELK